MRNRRKMEDNVKIVEYKFEDIQNIANLLNTITVTGLNNCEAISKIVAILEAGTVNTVVNKREEKIKNQKED